MNESVHTECTQEGRETDMQGPLAGKDLTGAVKQLCDRISEELDSTGYAGNKTVQECLAGIISLVDASEAPPAKPRKTGYWIIRKWGAEARCSECGRYFSDAYDMDNSDRYCRSCGTKMEGVRILCTYARNKYAQPTLEK